MSIVKNRVGLAVACFFVTLLAILVFSWGSKNADLGDRIADSVDRPSSAYDASSLSTETDAADIMREDPATQEVFSVHQEPTAAPPVQLSLTDLRTPSGIPINPFEDPLFESEPVDPEWSSQMESTLFSVASTLGRVEEVVCKTTRCRAIVFVGKSNELLGNEEQVTTARGHNRIVAESLRPNLLSPGGRLSYLNISTYGSESEPKLMIYVAGETGEDH